MTTVLLFVMLFVFMLMGMPIAIALGLSSLLTILLFGQDSLASLALKLFETSEHFTLLAIPFFILSGTFMTTGGVAKRMIRFANACIGHLRGGLAMASVMACMLFAAVSGSSPATVVAVGSIVIAGMARAGYTKAFSAGVICNAGTLGILIPPSIMLIVYAAASGVSIVRLYAGALLPGFLLAGMYLVYIVVRALLNPGLAPQRPRDAEEIPVARLMWMLLTSFFPLAVLILSVLGAILFGLATPSEAAAIGALGGLVLAAAYRALTWRRLQESVYLTVRTTAMVCWLFVGSWTFASVFSYLGGEQVVREFVVGLDMTPLQFLLLAQLIIFLLGWPLEWSEIIIIFVPIFLPLLPLFNIDPLFFGILIALNLQTSFLTPPMAMSAYYLKGIAPPQVRLTQIFAGSLPYVFMVFITMIVLYVFPDIVNWLPRLFYGR